MSKGKYLGIDYGDRRVGIAVSDFDKEISFPRDFLEYEKESDLLKSIKQLCEDEQIIKIILGLPIHMDGTFGERAEKTKVFYDKLKDAIPSIDIDFFDERLSSEYATKVLHVQQIKSKDQKGKRDSISAQIILQNYLASKR